MEYQYSDQTVKPDIYQIRVDINASTMADKNVDHIRWDEETETLSIYWTGSLSAGDKSDLDTIVAAHTGVAATEVVKYPPVNLHTVKEDVTSDGTFEEVASVFSRPESIVGVLANSYVYLLGSVECDATGGDPKFRVRALPAGGGAAVDIITSTSIADTAGVATVFSQFTPKNLPTGYSRYVIEARLNGGTSLCIKNLSATPLEDV